MTKRSYRLPNVLRFLTAFFVSSVFLTRINAFDLNAPHVRGTEAEAIHAALDAFRSKFKIDLKHYSVYVDHLGKNIEVTFLPDQPPKTDKTYGNVGGETIYGPSISYLVSVPKLKILSVEFGR